MLLLASALGALEEGEPKTADRRSVHYRVVTLPPMEEPLFEHIGPWRVDLLAKLNRCSPQHLNTREELVLPEPWDLPELAYSPFPFEIDLEEVPKLLVLHQPAQVFGAYEHGRLVRWGPVSSGRQGHRTPSGLFHLNWKDPGRYSTVDPDWHLPWYFNFENDRGFSLHQYSLPCRPASHGCVRLLERDARWLYHWGEEWKLGPQGWDVLENGTPFVILGDYDFEAPPPWVSPAGLEGTLDLSSLSEFFAPEEPTLHPSTPTSSSEEQTESGASPNAAPPARASGPRARRSR